MSARSLDATLRRMEDAGLVDRRVHPGSPPAVSYEMTTLARSLLGPLAALGRGYLETSFLPGRSFASPADFNAQLGDWLAGTANARTVRSIQGRPADLLAADLAAMTALPAAAPATGLAQRVRLGRDYYVRVDTCDYSADPRFIGRLVDVTATPDTVRVCCGEHVIASHPRSWARNAVITDPAHKDAAAAMRQALALDRAARGQARRHSDGHPVTLRALPDYDALFDFLSFNAEEGRAAADPAAGRVALRGVVGGRVPLPVGGRVAFRDVPGEVGVAVPGGDLRDRHHHAGRPALRSCRAWPGPARASRGRPSSLECRSVMPGRMRWLM